MAVEGEFVSEQWMRDEWKWTECLIFWLIPATVLTMLVMLDSNLPPQHLFWWHIPTAYHEESHQCCESRSTEEPEHLHEVGSPDWNHILGIIVVIFFENLNFEVFCPWFFQERSVWKSHSLLGGDLCESGSEASGLQQRNPMIVELKFAVHHLLTTNPFALLILNKT